MVLNAHILPLDRPFADSLARWLLANLPDAARGDLTGSLVVLPSSRACATLRDALLEASGRRALLLPEILQLSRFVDGLAGRLDLLGPMGATPSGDHAAEAPPPDHLRPLLLAGPLRGLPWVERHPESAVGLARELVAAFDDIRRAGVGRLLESEAATDPPAGGGDAAARTLWGRDLSRLREGWACYRAVVPCDRVDRLLTVVEALEGDRPQWPGPAYERIVVAGLSDLSPVEARLLRAALRHADGDVFLSEASDSVSRAWLATFHDASAASHPLAPARRLRALLTGDRGGMEATGAGAGAGAGGSTREPDLTLHSCDDPEQESLVVAGLVCEEIKRRADDLRRCAPVRVAVATGDRSLARRIAARLRDAGVSVDDSGGSLLSHLPAGQLACLLLRAAASDVHHRPLLEVLTHPYTRLLQSRSAHTRRTMLFERLLLRGEIPPLGLEEYRRRAVERDQLYQRLHPGSPQAMSAFVEEIARALAPLLALADGVQAWPVLVDALRETWRRFAPDASLDPRQEDQGRQAFAALLDELDGVADRLGQLGLAEFAAEMTRLIGARRVWPHRSAYLPVQITGLLEARLESYDLLLLSGLTDDVLPGRLPRPLLLGEADRIALGLPTWRDRLGLHAELFLRLLHNGGRVILTWPREIAGQPASPSPFVERLALALGISTRDDALRAPRPSVPRRVALPVAAIAAAETAFRAEPEAIPAAGEPAPTRRVSHSALLTYRNCPYRFLLERGHGLAEDEEVREEFRRLDYGQIVHRCLQVFLSPGGEGARALTAGDRRTAIDGLHAVAASLFAEGATALPQRRLWEAAFAGLAPEIVDAELVRRERWAPICLEASFGLTLGDLAAWIARESARQNLPEAAPALSPDEAALLMRGTLDRLEIACGRESQAAVIDYKTGAPPSARDVATGDDLQLHIYAVAVEAGAVAGHVRGELRVTEAAYYTLKRGQVGVRKPHYSEERPGRSALLAGATAALELAVAARDVRRPFPLIPRWRSGEARGEPPCRYCHLRGVCRIDERALGATLRAQLAAGDQRRTGVGR